MKPARIKVVKENELSFWDGSSLKLNATWAKALADKLRYQKQTLRDFLAELGDWLEERWETKTCSDRFGVVKWADVDEFFSLRSEFTNIAQLAEHELYHYLRPWIMGLILAEGGDKAIILTGEGEIEYPSDERSKAAGSAKSRRASESRGEGDEAAG